MVKEMKYTTEQATQKVIDTINTLQDAESASIDKYMSRYACFREIAGTAEYETHYQNIAYMLFGDYADDTEDSEDETETVMDHIAGTSKVITIEAKENPATGKTDYTVYGCQYIKDQDSYDEAEIVTDDCEKVARFIVAMDVTTPHITEKPLFAELAAMIQKIKSSTQDQIEEADADRPSAVIALFQKKLKKFNEGSHDYDQMEQYAKQAKLQTGEYIMTLLEITQNDIKKQPDGYRSKLYQELKKLHDQKLVASNQHRQEHGHIDRWWFTAKGIKKLNKKYHFC